MNLGASIYFSRVLCFVVALAGALACGRVHSAALRPGDIVVDVQTVGQIVVVDPLSGSSKTVSSGGLLLNPSHVIIDQKGQVLVAERGGPSGSGIVRIDPATGSQSFVSTGGLLTTPAALAFDANGDLIVGNYELFNNKLVHVDIVTGKQSPLANFSGIFNIQDIEVDNSGQIYVLDAGIYPGGPGRIVRIDPVTKAPVNVSTAGLLVNPSDMLFDPSGDLLVADGLRLIRVDPISGAQQLQYSLPGTGWIAMETSDSLIFADFASREVSRVNIASGQTHLISDLNSPSNLVGVAVFRPIPEPSALALSAIGAAALLTFAARRRRP